MNEIYIVDGQKYEVASNRKEEFLTKFPNAQLFEEPGKTTPTTPDAVVEETAASDQPSMELDSEDTSLGLTSNQSLKEQDKLRRQTIANVISTIPGGVPIGEKGVSKLAGITKFFTENIAGFVDSVERYVAPGLDLKNNVKLIRALIDKDPKKIAEFGERFAEISEGFDMSGLYKLSDQLDQLSLKYYNEEGAQMDVLGLIENGRMGDAADLAIDQAIGSAPSLAITILNPLLGSAFLGMGTTGKEFETALKERPEATLEQIYKASALKGAAEFGTEWAGGKLFRVLNKFDKAGIDKKIVKEFTGNYLKRFLSKGVGGFAAEGVTEGATDTFQQAADQLIYGDEKDFVDYYRGFVNSAIVGGLLGGPVSSITGVAQMQQTKQNKEAVYNFIAPQKIQSEILELNTQIAQNKLDLDNAPITQKESIQKDIDGLQEQANKIKNNLNNKFDALSKSELRQYADNLNAIDNAFTFVNNKKYSQARQNKAKKIIADAFTNNENILGDIKFYDANVENVIKKNLNAFTAIKEKGLKFKGVIPEDLDIKYINSTQAAEIPGMNPEADGAYLRPKTEGQKAIIFINTDIAAATDQVNVAEHELLHYIISKMFKTDNASMQGIISEFRNYMSTVLDPKVVQRIEQRIDEQYRDKETGKISKGALEEYLNVFSDIDATQKLDINETGATKLKTAFNNLMINIGFKQAKFETGKDLFNFIRNYNNNVSLFTKRAGGKKFMPLPEQQERTEYEDIIKESRSQEASDRVQKIYDEQGVNGAFEIIEEFKPITLKITRKRNQAPNYDEELLSSEIEIGKGGLLDLIQSYKPESGVPLAAYINKNLPLRAIAASKRILGEQFTEDVTEMRDVAMQEEISRKEEMEEREIAEEIKSLRKQIGLSEDLVARTKDAVMKTFGTKLPSPEDSKFKLALQTAFRVELKKPMSKFVGRQADYENFLRDNFEVIYNKLTINTLAKRFRDFAEPVIDERTGKQAREKTDEGNKIFKKKNITKAEFIAYFLGSNVGRSTQGTRKTAIVEAIAEEIAFDATMEVLRDPMVTERYLQISELIGDPLPENFKSLIAKQIDRGEDFKFSKSLPTKFSLTNQELANILINNTLLEVADGNPDIANAIFDEAFIQSFPATFKDIILPAYKKAINNADKALQIELGKSFIKLFSRPLRTFSYKGSEIKGEYRTNESVFNILSDLLPDSLINENGFKLQDVARGKSIFYNNEKIVDLFDVTQKNVLERVINKKITKEDFKKQNNHALYELKNLIFNLGESNPGLALSIIKLMQSDNRSIFRQAARLNAVVQNYSGELRYEHNPPVQHVFEQITDYLTDKTVEKRDELDNLLNTMEANIVPRDFADIVDKKYKTKAHPEGLRYKDAIDKTNYEFDSPSFKFSKTKITDFNKIIERATGFKTRTKLAEVKADKLAKNKGKFRFFIPPSADDFAGLLYYITGKGKQGDADMQYFKETFFDPFAKGIAKFDESKQKALANFKQLKKLIRKTPARLSKQNETGFTNEEVSRIYIWNSLGYDIPGLTQKDIKDAVKFIKNNNELLEFAQNVKGISVLGYPKPDNGWVAGTMTTDLLSYVNETVRADFLKDWKTNVDATLKKPDVLNKLKATYGENYTGALEDILYRMETGRRRPMGNNKLTNQVMNWVNDSVGAIMFFNTRSALLQQLSFVNFINFSDNNPLSAGATFVNQKQFWKDYADLFNSDFLKQRRSGLKTDVNADEIAKAAESGKNPIRSVIASILKKGFLPTQIADSHAIALGGASFYRNRINRYKKEGKSQQEAEQQAFLDFQEIAEETQQSSRPDRISMQQASPLGRIILAFANTPMQYARLTKKAALDLANGRGDWKTNLSKLMYYSLIQNVIFTALQGAMFAMIFDETDDEEKDKDKYYRAANNISDSLLRGLGFGGAAVATGKNMVLEAIKQYESKRPDYQKVALKSLSLSPPIDSKMRKMMAAGRTFTYRQSKEKIRTEGLSLDNPAFEAVGQIISATTNLPADRVVRKLDNLTTPVRQDVETWQAISLALGYSKWDVGLIESQAKKPKKSATGLKTKKLKTKKLK